MSGTIRGKQTNHETPSIRPRLLPVEINYLVVVRGAWLREAGPGEGSRGVNYSLPQQYVT